MNLDIKTNRVPNRIDDENEFNRIGVEIFKEIGTLIRTISSGPKLDRSSGKETGFSKEEAVIVGTLVRYGKLGIGFIEQYAKARLETTMIMFRCLAETYVNLNFFIKYADTHTLRHYIKHSLQTENQVLKILKQNTASREILEPIEQRIIKSMEKAFDDADFKQEDMNHSSKWNKKIKARLSDILHPNAYSLIYGSASHSIHGNWQDLVSHNLTKQNDGYYPQCRWTEPRLQILTVASIFSCEVLKNYADKFLSNNKDKQALDDIISDIMERSLKLDKMHEEFIQNS